MVKRKTKRRTPEQLSDYDGAWKEFLRCYFRVLIEKYFPGVAAEIDWRFEPYWSNKELSQVIGRAGQRNQTVDALVRVRLLNGTEQWIYLHLEIQTSPEQDFALRASLYNSGLFWIFKERVATLLILADLREDWLPTEDVFRFADFESRTRFSVCKLIHRLESDWRNDHSLPVQIARAQIAALRTASDPEGRYQAKWQLVRNLYEMGYNAQELRELFRFIDWMMQLRKDLSNRFRQELQELEGNLKMPYITSIERLALAEGEAQGGATVLLRQLDKKCGVLSEDVRQRVRGLRMDQLEALSEAVLDFVSLHDLQAWLDAHAEADGDESSVE